MEAMIIHSDCMLASDCKLLLHFKYTAAQREGEEISRTIKIIKKSFTLKRDQNGSLQHTHSPCRKVLLQHPQQKISWGKTRSRDMAPFSLIMSDLPKKDERHSHFSR